MNITIALSQVFGITFAILGLSMLFNKKDTALAVEEMVQSKGFMWMGGFLALIIGAVIIAFNKVGNSRLHSLIAIIGWLSLIKGVFLLLFPNLSVSFYRKVNKGSIFILAGIIVFVLGLVLLYKGFM